MACRLLYIPEVNDEIPDNVVVVDIDNDAVFIPDTTSAENPQLPEKEEQKLVKALQEIAEPVRLNRVGAGRMTLCGKRPA